MGPNDQRSKRTYRDGITRGVRGATPKARRQLNWIGGGGDMDGNIAFSIPALRNTVRSSCAYKIFKHNFRQLLGALPPAPSVYGPAPPQYSSYLW